ncbi:MAG: hypothetical protein IJS32_03150 [Kiritimatiellae bacterium]|nr:hypothetical protein [Kiritimatiellia bacterium]
MAIASWKKTAVAATTVSFVCILPALLFFLKFFFRDMSKLLRYLFL